MSGNEATGPQYIPTYSYLEASLEQNSRQGWKILAELWERLTASDSCLRELCWHLYFHNIKPTKDVTINLFSLSLSTQQFELCNHPLYRLLIKINILRLYVCVYIKKRLYIWIIYIGIFFFSLSQHLLCVCLYLFEASQYFYTHTYQYKLLGILALLRIHNLLL